MALDVFSFPNHTVTHEYPKGNSFKFGGGYEFAATPITPIQRRFRLNFATMVWRKNASNQFDATIDAPNNILAFDQFYRAHLTHIPFTYNHEVYGALTVKFSADAPFVMPKGVGGAGATEGFEIVLVEQP